MSSAGPMAYAESQPEARLPAVQYAKGDIAMLFRRIALLPMALLLCIPVLAQAKPDQLHTLSRDELDVIKVLTQQERAWNSANIEAYVGAYKRSPDTLYMAGAVTRGFDDIMLDYRKNYPNKDSMGSLAFSDLEPHVLDPKFAVVLGKYHVDRNKKAGGPADGIFSLVLEKTDQGWKIIVAHTT